MLTFTVNHPPAPKGSKRAFVNKHTGRVNLVESSKRCPDFVNAVADKCAQARGELVILGPCYVSLFFYLPRPASAPKRVTCPAKKPDLDKLIRAALDGITHGGAWHDDAQVVQLAAAKVFGEPARLEVTITEAKS